MITSNGSAAADPAGDAARRGLVMASDPELLDTVLRLAAAVGCEITRAADPSDARRRWLDAPLVVLDATAARSCAEAALPRRPGVVVAVCGDPPPETWRHAVAVGAEHVVSVPQAEAWLVAALTEAAEGSRPSGAVIAVIGGRGGAGASVFATALAVAAVRTGDPALLVDCDPLGGGLDLLLGAEDLEGLRWSQIGVNGGRIPATALHAALPAPRIGGSGDGRLGVLSCERATNGPAPGAVVAVLEAGRRAGETVVCDIPRYPTDAALAALSTADVTIVVVPADLRSCAAAARIAELLAERGIPAGVVVRGPSPGGVDADQVAASLGLPLLTTMRPEPRLARRLELGRVPGVGAGPLHRAARPVLVEVAPLLAVRGGASA
ncbi:MAG: CpaE-like family protein [Pseudonocardia sp.]|nr:CpaE-like family protein [Pseudonocardia sp.]